MWPSVGGETSVAIRANTSDLLLEVNGTDKNIVQFMTVHEKNRISLCLSISQRAKLNLTV